MSNHEHRCRGCGNDLRRESGNHEGNCLASKLQQSSKDLDTLHAVIDRLEATEKAAHEAWHEQEDELQSLRGKLHDAEFEQKGSDELIATLESRLGEIEKRYSDERIAHREQEQMLRSELQSLANSNARLADRLANETKVLDVSRAVLEIDSEDLKERVALLTHQLDRVTNMALEHEARANGLASRLDEAVMLLRHWMPESELRRKGFAVEKQKRESGPASGYPEDFDNRSE